MAKRNSKKVESKDDAEVEIEDTSEKPVSVEVKDTDEVGVADDDYIEGVTDLPKDDDDEEDELSAEETIEAVKQRLAKTETDLAAERAASREKDELLQKESTRASTTEAEMIRTWETNLENSITGTNEKLDQLQKELEDAYDEGDSPRIAQTQRELTKATIHLSQLEGQKAQFEAWKEQQKTAKTSRPAAPDSGGGYTPAAKEWIDRHPKFNSDPVYRNIALAGDQIARERGVELDSPQYFEIIEQTVAKYYDKAEGGSRSSAASTGARPTRDHGDGGRAERANRVTLTPEEVAFARESDISLEEYARNKLALKKEGRLGAYSNKRQAM